MSTSEAAPLLPAPAASEGERRLTRDRPKLRRLAQQAIRTADRASGLLPKVLDKIEDKLDEMSGKELVGAGSLLERLSAQRALVSKAAGLGKNSGQGSSPQTVVNVQIRADLPLEERIRLIQSEVNGVPTIMPRLEQVPERRIVDLSIPSERIESEATPTAPDAAARLQEALDDA